MAGCYGGGSSGGIIFILVHLFVKANRNVATLMNFPINVARTPFLLKLKGSHKEENKRPKTRSFIPDLARTLT